MVSLAAVWYCAANAAEEEAEAEAEESTSSSRSRPKWLYLSPIRIQGDVGFGYTRSMVANIKPEAEYRTGINIMVGRSVAGYIWKPWMALWDGEIQVGFSSAQRVIQQTANTNLDNSDTLNRRVMGNLNLNVLPRSRFPLRGYVQQNQTDSSEGKGFTGTGNMRRRYGISQKYQTEDGKNSVALLFDGYRDYMGTKNHSGYMGASLPSVNWLESRSRGDSISLRSTSRFESQLLDMVARRVRSESVQQDALNRNHETGVVVNHDMAGEDGWNLTSVGDVSRMWNYTESFVRNTVNPGVPPPGCQTNNMPYWNDADFLTHQITNTLFWRAQETPFSMNASTRYNRTHDWQGSLSNTASCQDQLPDGIRDPTRPIPQKDSVGSVGRLQKTHDARVGLNYMLMPTVSVNSDMNGTFIDAKNKEAQDRFYRGSGNTNISYDPQGVELGPFNYRWFGGVGVVNNFADGSKPLRVTTQRLGHGIGHTMPMPYSSNLNSSISEGITSFQQSGFAPLWTINHMVSTQLDRSEGRNRSFGSLGLMDNRTMGNQIGNTQNMNVQISHSMDSGEGRTITGNMTNQWGRVSNESMVMPMYNRYSAIDINFTDSEIFDLPGLRYSSMIRFGAPAMLPLGRFAGYESRSWFNRVDYQIGKIVVSLTGMLQDNSTPTDKSKTEGLVLFELRRYFDIKF
ncbi:MAG: hypothetical protein HQL55_06095 [Magnetococcales bacterium]|nr:hypothetical protein [Magnetococcales bacterium]